MGALRFASIRIRRGESDLWIAWNGQPSPTGRPSEAALVAQEVERSALSALEEARGAILAYGAARPEFLESFDPIAPDDDAPPLPAAMIRASRDAGVGPTAAVAGAIAEAVGRAVKAGFGFAEVVVENGGDLWIDVASPLTVSVYAGLSSLSESFGIVVGAELCPCGLACSSGTVGPSTSFGKADAAIVISRDAAAADAWATALGNRIRSAADMEPSVRFLLGLPEATTLGGPRDSLAAERRPVGALAVMADRLAAAGSIVLAPLRRGSASGSIEA